VDDRRSTALRHTPAGRKLFVRAAVWEFEKGSVESTHKVPTSHYHTKHRKFAMASIVVNKKDWCECGYPFDTGA
jgi:hypothetical protein